METDVSVLNIIKPQIAQRVTSAHAQRRNLRKRFRTLEELLQFQAVLGALLDAVILKRAIHMFRLRINFFNLL